MNKYKVSIVVPVYNVEKYLLQCVESIISQNYSNKEIILVNDGSTDNSAQICDEYAKKYSEIKVVHKENGGLSDARNEGMRAAEGDYVLFIDSDDFIESGSLNKIMEVANSTFADVIFLEAYKYYDDGKSISMNDGITEEGVSGKSKEEVFEFLMQCPKFPAAAWSKLLNRNLLAKKNISFEKGLLSEDIDWCLKLLCSAESFAYCREKYYNYRQAREGSITNSIGEKNINDLIYILKKWVKLAEDYNEYEKKLILCELAYEYPIILAGYGGLEKRQKEKYRQELKNLKWILKYKNGIRYTVIKLLCGIIGTDLTGKFLNFYLKHR